MEIWYNHLCPDCRPAEEGDPDEDAADPSTPEEQAAHNTRIELTNRREENRERHCWISRWRAFQEAMQVHREAKVVAFVFSSPGISNMGYVPSKRTAGVNDVDVPLNSIPLDYQPDTHLIDITEFSSPRLKIVPPGTIPTDSDKCGICWGSLVALGDEACGGGGARMLDCGHVYGKTCIANTFERWTNCPFCTREYRIRHQPRYGFVESSILGLVEDQQLILEPRWLIARAMLLGLLSPIVFAVVMTMDIGNRQHPQDPRRNRSLLVKILIILGSILGSPYIYVRTLGLFWVGFPALAGLWL
jgi:hypothetical protein